VSGLTAGELTQMRAVTDDYLPGTAYILTRTLASDGQGGSTETWGTAGTVSWRISPLSETERAQQDRVSALRERIVTVAYGATVTQRDRLKDASDGTTYEIDGVDSPRSYELDRRVHVTEVD
jgi:SPP1 family predicted phage head-tail adaptor